MTIDQNETDVLDAVTDQVDLLLNLSPIEPGEFTAAVRLVRDGESRGASPSAVTPASSTAAVAS